MNNLPPSCFEGDEQAPWNVADAQVCPECGEFLIIEKCGWRPTEWEEISCPNGCYSNTTEPDFELEGDE